MPHPSIAVIINPRSGTRSGPDAAKRRGDLASAFLAQRGGDPAEVFITERRGHARELAGAAAARGIATVVCWGGDGTMNEVGSALVFTGTAMALIPAGSGNGLARELRIPFNPTAALELACGTRELTIDAGQIGDRYFFNVAGIGLDARVAARFSADTNRRRGLARYAELTIREFWGFTPEEITVTANGRSVTKSALLVAIANGRQYGNGATIAPDAQFDDGKLDVVVYENRSTVRACAELPLLFTRRITACQGVASERVDEVEIRSPKPMPYHLDGEPVPPTNYLKAIVRRRALRVKTVANH